MSDYYKAKNTEPEELKKAIESRGLRHSFIADKLGVSRSLITHWLNGTNKVSDAHKPLLLKLINK